MTNNKLGRNDLCSCGSGKKYKKCCMPGSMSSGPELIDLSWHRLRHTEGEVIDNHLMPYLTKTLSKDTINKALEDFCPNGLPEGMDEEDIFISAFIPWFLFNWVADDLVYEDFDPKKTIAENYLTSYGSNLSSTVRSFIEAINKTYYSFYSVQEVVPEKRLVIKDILLGTIHTIKEQKATRVLKRGDIIFSRILTLNDQSIFVGMAPYNIPARYHTSLIDYRDWLIEENDNRKLTEAVLHDFSSDELIDQFFEIMEELYNQPLPTMLNTDGDPILFSKSYFKVALPPADVLKRLLPITLSEDDNDFTEDAECDATGAITKIEFPWLKKGNKKHKNWDNTVMGHITVEKNKLTLETNSEKRTEQGKALLNKYLGKYIVFQSTLLETPEQKLKSDSRASRKHQYEQEQAELLAFPEIQEQIQQLAKAHWENWFDEKILALGNKTPRQAARTKDGRERLEALLLHYESSDARKSNKLDPFKADINYLKRELGLL